MKRTVLLLAAVLYMFSALAQTRDSISGTVYVRNQPLPGAVIRLLNSEVQAVTDAEGRFSIDHLKAGSYQAAVNAKGYASRIINIQVPLAQPLRIDLSAYDRELNEVVITAQKREQALQQVPASITSINADVLAQAMIWDIKSLTAFSPNLSIGNPGDNRNVTGIRGIVTTSYNPAVATYVDGVNQFNLDTYIAPLLDAERVEILRGPQGTLYGRNAMGGVINIITRQPGNTPHGFAEVSGGDYGLKRYSLGLSLPIVKDRLFLSIAGLFSSLNGYYSNRYNGSKFDRQHFFLSNYTLKYTPGRQWNISLNVKNLANRNQGAFPLAGSVEEALAHPFTVNQNAVAQMVDNTLNALLAANHTGRYFNFYSQTAYQQNYRYYTQPIDGDFSPADAVSIVNNYGPDWNKVKTATQEFRFTSPAGRTTPLSWVAGAYGFVSNAPNKSGTHFGQDAGLIGSPQTNFTSITINKSKIYGLALFAQATYTILPKLNLTAGLRYDAERNKQTIEGMYQPDGAEALITQPDTAAKAGFHAMSPTVNLSWQAGENHLLYGSYNRGFRSGGISPLSSDPSQPPLCAFAPEHSNNFEVGLKNKFTTLPLQWNIAVFYTSLNDAQVPSLILPDAITITRNVGRLHSKGVETELVYNPVKGLALNYSFGYTHARYQDLVVGANGTAVNLSGNRQLFTPTVTSLLAAQYSYALNKEINLIARADWRYLGRQYFDLANRIEQRGYSVINLRVGAGVKNYQLFVWGSNLFNKHYFDYAYDFGAIHYGNPRVLGATLRASF